MDKDEQTHYGNIQISYGPLFDLLHQVLMLPQNYKVWGCNEGDDVFQVFVESPSIPYVEDGKPRPLVTPTYRRNEDGSTSLLGIEIDGVKQEVSNVATD